MTRFLLTTDPGREDIVLDEARERWPEATPTRPVDPLSGRVLVELPGEADPTTLRTVHHVTELRALARAASLDDVRRVVAAVEIPELERARSFRASTTRVGEHPFSSQQIAGAAGAALQRRWGTPVDLEHFEINVRVDLVGDELLVGIQRTRESLGKRIRRARTLRTSLKPTIAAAMVRLARAHRGAGSLLDPLCGTGTIAIEAASINPALTVAASDWDEQTVACARETIAGHGLGIEVRRLDVREISAGWGRRFDAIVTDPPYGLRQGRRVRLGALYTFVLRGCLDALADRGRMVVICPRRRAFEGAIRRLPLTVVHERVVETGGLYPRIWALEPE